MKHSETIYYDESRVALAKATDLADTVPGGLLQADRVRLTIEGNVLGRKQETRKDGRVEWVKVIDVDKSYDLTVLSRLSELPFEVVPGTGHVDSTNPQTITPSVEPDPAQPSGAP